MNTPLIVHPFRPLSERGWEEWQVVTSHWEKQPYAIARWYNRANEVSVISSIEMVEESYGKPPRPEYHISVSGLAYVGVEIYRCSEQRAQWVLKKFGAENFTQDNHVPNGKVRNYWRPVADPLAGQSCPCIEVEPAVKEMKGDYIWRDAKP